MGRDQLVDFLRSWTSSNELALRHVGVAISLVLPHDPSAVAVAVLIAELRSQDSVADADLIGQLAVAADGLCVVEVSDTATGETLYKNATATGDESQLSACLSEFVARMRS